ALAFIETNRLVLVRALGNPVSTIIDLPAQAALSERPMAVSTNGVVVFDQPGDARLIRPDGQPTSGKLPRCGPSSPLLLSPNGQCLVYFTPDSGNPSVWDIVQQRQVCQITNTQRAISSPAIAADSRQFAFGYPNG